jgi:hypothetical protein
MPSKIITLFDSKAQKYKGFIDDREAHQDSIEEITPELADS